MMSVLKEQKACPRCSKTGRGKSLAVYDDHVYCFECKYTEQTMSNRFVRGEIRDIPERGLSKEVCGRYNIRCGTYTGHIAKRYVYDEPVYIYPIYKAGKQTGQVIRSTKDSAVCTQLGDCKGADMGGLEVFEPTDKIPVIICESIFDAASINQVMNYPALYTYGTSQAPKKIAKSLVSLEKWKHVVLVPDSDEAGEKMVDSCLGYFQPGKVKIAKIPLKDPNEMLQAGRTEELKKCIWNAAARRPPYLVRMSDIRDQILTKPEMGLSWPYPTMTEVTYGMRMKEWMLLMAAPGVGKTELLKEIIFHFADQEVPVGVFSFEQAAEDTSRRLIGTSLNKRLHIPSVGDDWHEDAINKCIQRYNDNILLYNNTGILDLPILLSNIRYAARCDNVKLFVIDNLTAMCASPIIDGKVVSDSVYVGHICVQLNALVKELNIHMIVVSHINEDSMQKKVYVSTTPRKKLEYLHTTAEDMDTLINRPGLTWETGRMPGMQHIYGSKTAGKLADYVIALARNTVAEDPTEKRTTIVKFLKTRFESSNTGKTFKLHYNYDSGRLIEPEINDLNEDLF